MVSLWNLDGLGPLRTTSVWLGRPGLKCLVTITIESSQVRQGLESGRWRWKLRFPMFGRNWIQLHDNALINLYINIYIYIAYVYYICFFKKKTIYIIMHAHVLCLFLHVSSFSGTSQYPLEGWTTIRPLQDVQLMREIPKSGTPGPKQWKIILYRLALHNSYIHLG